MEAARAAIEFAFGTIGAKGLSAGHHPENVNSKKVIEKLGFHYDHDEFFDALRINIPYYLLAKPQYGKTLPQEKITKRGSKGARKKRKANAEALSSQSFVEKR